MRERVRDAERLKHILDAIDGILKNQEIYSFKDIEVNSIIFYGFVKHLEIIGEAVYMLTKEYKAAHPDVEWLIIEKMRHVLVHGYYQILPEQLWKTIKCDIPELKPKIEVLYKEEIASGFDILEEPRLCYGKEWLSNDLKNHSIFDLIRDFS